MGNGGELLEYLVTEIKDDREKVGFQRLYSILYSAWYSRLSAGQCCEREESKMKMKRGTALWLPAMLLVSANLFIQGCSEPLNITATPVRDVERIEVKEKALDVYCPRGICKFELKVNQKAELTINMFYDTEQPFTKIEGVSVTGESGNSMTMDGQHQFKMAVKPQKEPITVQVVDYYRS